MTPRKPSREKQPEKKRRVSQVGSTHTGRTMLIVLLGLALTITVFLVVIYPMVMVSTDKEANIKVPAKATPEQVHDTLSKYYGDDFTNTVLRLARLRGIDISQRHGAYTISQGSNAIAAMRKLTSGAQTPVRITINGFRNFPRMIELISKKMEFSEDSLKAALANPAILEKYGLTPDDAMALFIDDTYEVYWTASPRELIDKIGENYLYLWDEVRCEKARQLGLTPAGIMTIASIADEETNLEEEKGKIGRLYINRLNTGMKLQADPTVRFAMGDFTIQRITRNDLKTDSPYNTYLYKGLPPGPIRTTSYATVKAILDAPPHNYLYMCAKEDFSGSHNFAVTYSEHMQNALRYQAELDRKGITR